MLVRLNQIDPRTAEASAGWTTGGPRGAFTHGWPAGTLAFELVALDRDERGTPVAAAARRAEVRRTLANVVAAVGRPGDVLVVRVDGPFGPGLMPAVAAAAGADRCAVSPTQRLAGDGPQVVSVRFTATDVDRLCRDEQLALSDGVRLRAFPLPAAAVDPMLDTADPDDERWRDLLPAAAAVVSSAADGLSVVVWTNHLTADQLRDRLATRLAAA